MSKPASQAGHTNLPGYRMVNPTSLSSVRLRVDAQFIAPTWAAEATRRRVRIDSTAAVDLIEQLMGVAYHPGHTWKLLRQRLRWRLQRPTRRAIERDERAIARWVAEDWPSDPAQRPASSGGYGVLGRVGASLLAVARRTWTPRGATPVIRHHFNWKRASMAAGLCYGSRGSRLTP